MHTGKQRLLLISICINKWHSLYLIDKEPHVCLRCLPRGCPGSHHLPKLLPGEHRSQFVVQLDGSLHNFQALASVATLHLEQSIRLEDLGGAGAFLVLGVLRQDGPEEVEEDRSRALDIVLPLFEERQEERRYGQPGVIASVGVVLDIVDDAPIQPFGLVELAGFDERAREVVIPGLPNLGPELVRAGAGEGRRKLTAGAALLLPGDGGVVLEAEVDPVFATPVECALRLMMMRISRALVAGRGTWVKYVGARMAKDDIAYGIMIRDCNWR